MENQQNQQTSPELTIVDLQNIRAIIDVASRRGAFGANEMVAVGTTFNKLDSFLNSVSTDKQTQTEVTQPKE